MRDQADGHATGHLHGGGTREQVARLVLEEGPITAAAVAKRLGLSPPAVRRHLDALLADGEATTRSAPRGPRGRGRPAKLFLLTAAGRARFGHAYDDLAVAALRFVADTGGNEAVKAFARQRMAALVDRHRPAILAGTTTTDRTQALADALTVEGYAASACSITVRGTAIGGQAGEHIGEQLCQHHCPVAHVAAEFPELCEVETATFAELLGTHVQRLATIARGDAVCTTHIPTAHIPTGHIQNDTLSNPDEGAPA
jgi:predicted ArsR family transcriptional regulator